MEIVVLILIMICLTPIYLGRKRIGFYFCPEEIIGFRKKNHYITGLSLLPALIIVAFVVSYLREIIRNIDYLKEYENYSLVIGAIIFLVLLYSFGLLTEKIVYHSNSQYKEWKNNKSKDKERNTTRLKQN